MDLHYDRVRLSTLQMQGTASGSIIAAANRVDSLQSLQIACILQLKASDLRDPCLPSNIVCNWIRTSHGKLEAGRAACGKHLVLRVGHFIATPADLSLKHESRIYVPDTGELFD